MNVQEEIIDKLSWSFVKLSREKEPGWWSYHIGNMDYIWIHEEKNVLRLNIHVPFTPKYAVSYSTLECTSDKDLVSCSKVIQQLLKIRQQLISVQIMFPHLLNSENL
jgi:hypothetical protein